MTRFVLDARHVPAGRDDGAARVVLGILEACVAQLRSTEEAIVLALPDAVEKLRARTQGATVWPLDVRPASVAQLVGLGAVVSTLRPDAYFFPQYDLPLLPSSVPAVSYVYDVTPITFDNYFGAPAPWRTAAAAALLASTCARSRSVLCLSRYTADQVADLLPDATPKLRVCYPGPTPMPQRPPVSRARARFVYVGNHRPHKRVPLLLRAFARLRARVPDAELLLVGRPDPRFPDVPELVNGELGAGVQLITDADDAEVARLVASSRALVFPSTGEGFGMPVLEAYAMGTPAILSDAGSLPEVVGDAGLLVPALDETALADALHRLCTEDDLFSSLSAATESAHARFSWQRAGEVLLSALRDAAGGSR